jgi:hypothetical protein
MMGGVLLWELCQRVFPLFQCFLPPQRSSINAPKMISNTLDKQEAAVQKIHNGIFTMTSVDGLYFLFFRSQISNYNYYLLEHYNIYIYI